VFDHRQKVYNQELYNALAALDQRVTLVEDSLKPSPPPPPPISGADVFMAPSGNDANPCTQATPCQSFSRAYEVANPGDVVQVRGGTYGPQDLNYDAGNAVAPGVVFVEANGETAKVTGIGSDSALEMGRDGPGSAKFVTLDGIDLDQVYIRRTGGVTPEGITIRNAHLGTKQEAGLYSGSVKNFKLINVEFGPTCCNEDGAQIAQGAAEPADPTPDGVTLQKVNFHHVVNECADIPASVWPNCASESKPSAGNHVDCVQTTGWRNVVIRDSQFIQCQTGLQMGTEKGKSWNIDIRNSFFSGFHWVNFTCGGSCYGAHAWISPDPEGNQTWVKLYYNTFAAEANPGVRMQEIDPEAQIEFVGNIVHGALDCLIDSASGNASYDVRHHNLIGEGALCAPGDLSGNPSFVSHPNDLHLASGSLGINVGEPSCPSVLTDIDGASRPQGSACDIGADEEGAAP
jgi:hypothetical protein